MRKQNSEFLTAFTSEATNDIRNTDYFGFVELDNFACYVIADGIDDQLEAISAKLAVDAAVSAFSESPSMSKKAVKRCLKAANHALLEAKSKTKLKASIIIVLTNYVKLRYGQAGNIRLRLYRNGFIKEETTDQSLTMDMVKEEKVPQDKVAVHEERNNLYTYLGQEKDFHPYISKKKKLTDADALTLYTRGVWEHVDEGELKDAFADASDEPQELVDKIEDLIMSRQPADLKKYTLAVVFINKIFTDPNKKRKIKKIIMAAIAFLTIAMVIGIILFTFYQRRQNKFASMETGYTDTIEYIQMDNYVRAQKCCEDALELAEELKVKKMQSELGNYLKLIEAVISAQELLDKGEYSDAQTGFQAAAIRSRYVDHIGMDYINDKLALTADYISVYDLIYLGDTLALNLQYDKAEEKYMGAKALSAKIYFDKGRTAAIDALEKLYEDQKEQVETDNEKLKEQLTQEESGANYLAQGDTAYAQGDYESARVFYQSALQKYQELGDETQQTVVEEKLSSTENKLSNQSGQESEAEGYMSSAVSCVDAGDYSGARKYYLLAKDIYASLNDEDKLAEITRKMEVLDMKESEQQAAAAAAAAAEQ